MGGGGPPAPDLELHTAEVPLGSDEGVLVYTDGATDVRRGGTQLGLTVVLRHRHAQLTSSTNVTSTASGVPISAR